MEALIKDINNNGQVNDASRGESLNMPGFFLSRYNELLFIIDTCQGASMYDRFYSPNIMALASSQVGEDSLSVSI